jgi:DNA-directed RNA polymerase sigma subunit (sigma70/sigma32)
VPLAEALALDQAARVVTSLDRPAREEGGFTLGQQVPASGADVGEEVVLSLEQRAVRAGVEALAEPDREVFKRRFGMNGDPRPESHATIARRLGVSSAEVRAIEKRALADLARLRELDGRSRAA